MMFLASFFVVTLVSGGSHLIQQTTAAPTDHAAFHGTVPGEDVLLGCKDNPADIYFLLDCSSSVWVVDFEKQLDFVVSLIKYLDIQPNATRVGLGVFSDDFYHELDIGNYPDKNTLIRAVRATPYLSGNTYTGKGIYGMRTHGFRSEVVRPNVTKIGVVVTDGRSRHRTNTLAEATKTREEGIWLFSVGVGNSVDRVELEAIASVPKEEFSFYVASFDILSTLARKLAISSCKLERLQADKSVCGQKKPADVMFLYNGGAISAQELSSVKEFVEYMVGKFSMTTGKIRVGVTSRSVQGGDIQLFQYIRRDDFLNALVKQPKPRMSALLKKVRLDGFDPANGGRYGSEKRVIAFVDNTLHDIDDLKYEALLLRYEDVVIHVITLGPKVDLEQVKQVASSPNAITDFGSYAGLGDAKKRQAFLEKFCTGL